MNEDTVQRLFGFADAFEHSVTTWITGTVITSLVAALIAVRALRAFGRLEKAPYVELIKRIRSWGVLAPLLIVPILLGGAWVILAVAILSISCYREYARATGLFRHPMISLFVVLGILAVTFAVADHWYGFFVALPALGVSVIAAAGILGDQPRGYIQ